MGQRGSRVKQADAVWRLERPVAEPQGEKVLGDLLGGLRFHVQESPAGREPDTDDGPTGHTWGGERKAFEH
jgi:hypothetical protein